MSVPPSLLPVACTGARGAYSQRAALRYFGPGRTLLNCRSAPEAVRSVVEERASHALVPVENSVTGAFSGVAEAFFDATFSVVGEIELPIRHCLLAVPGARLDELAVVTSHASALAQCRDRLAEWGVATRPAEDTGEAAAELARSGERGLGVLGSRELAETYGLDVLCEGLSDRPHNRTRFLVLGPASGSASGTGLRAAACVGPLAAPRDLKTLRIQLESLGATRVRVPFLGSADGRAFVIEFDHRSRDPRETLEQASGGTPHRFLGRWDPQVANGNAA